MQTAQILNDYKFKNIINCNSNSKCEKKIRTQYSNSKYRDIFFRENNKLKRALNHKYWVAIQLEKLDEENLGQLIYFFELACAMSGKILGVNPFNQPGVEAYKKNMFRLLGKPGYEK